MGKAPYYLFKNLNKLSRLFIRLYKSSFFIVYECFPALSLLFKHMMNDKQRLLITDIYIIDSLAIT